MTLEDLQTIQRIDSELLNDVVDICEKNNIEYFLVFGTLIGAVRHSGPIPWDDDVDIAMTRDNYNRFLEVASTELDSKYKLYVMGSGDPKYISEIKIGRIGTRLCIPGTENLGIMKEINLDIFLVDYLKEHNKIAAKFYNKLRRFLLIAKLNWDEKKLLLFIVSKKGHKIKMIKKIFIYLSHILNLIFGEVNIEKFIYKVFVDVKRNSGKMGIIKSEKCNYYDSDVFENYTEIEYENRLFKVPAKYDVFLKGEYGEYMKFPSKENRYRKYFDEYILNIEKIS